MTAVQKSSTWSTSGMRAVYRNGRPDSVNTYNVPITSTVDEDSGRLRAVRIATTGSTSRTSGRRLRKLTVNVGLRFETNYGWQPAACQVETIFVRRAVLPGRSTVRRTSRRCVPRAVGRLRHLRRRRTALKFAASRYNQPITLQNVLRLNPLGATSDTRAVDGVRRRADLRLRPQWRSDAADRASSACRAASPSARTTATPTVSNGRCRTSTASSSSDSSPATSCCPSATRTDETRRNIGSAEPRGAGRLPISRCTSPRRTAAGR